MASASGEICPATHGIDAIRQNTYACTAPQMLRATRTNEIIPIRRFACASVQEAAVQTTRCPDQRRKSAFGWQACDSNPEGLKSLSPGLSGGRSGSDRAILGGL